MKIIAQQNTKIQANSKRTLRYFPYFPRRQKAEAIEKPKPEQPFEFTGMRLFCDECSVPLWLYGENFFETYTNGTANILRCLCDLCAAEFWEVD